MRTADFWKRVTMDGTDFLPEFLDLLKRERIRYAVIGGQAVNAYVDPLVSLVLDLVVAIDQRERAIAACEEKYKVERFEHSVNVSRAGSGLRVQIQTDSRYDPFVERAAERDVLGWKLPVASSRDVLQGKIWAAEDVTRRKSKRLKDLADIARLLERFPEYGTLVPAPILARLDGV